jgi:hypothetical protein
MSTEMGEYVVGAYLRLVLKCDLVIYNVKPPEGGLAGLAEIDVVGLNSLEHAAYLCEVTTHLGGIQYVKNYERTAEKIATKFRTLQKYAANYLHEYRTIKYIFWSPCVPKGRLLDMLYLNKGLEIVINQEYKTRIDRLRKEARLTTRDIGNPFFRALQILEHTRE